MKTAVLLSGGVDSSVALRLLKEQGHNVTAFYLKIWLEDELSFLGTCPWQEDLSYAQAVCDQAGVPLEVVSLQKEYWDEVVSYTIAEIKSGRTPNPDILCNQRVKFGAFYKKIDESFDFVATGHYAKRIDVAGQALLYRAPDAIKDQTYFLSHISQAQLKRALFPLGHLDKSQVRELAVAYNLPNKQRKDSQGICFLGKIKFSDFVKHHLGEREGALVEFETGKQLGVHKGFWYYTIGQRQGIGLAGGPWYVTAKDTATNCVYISRNYYCQEKERDTFIIEAGNWITSPPQVDKQLHVKMRHGPLLNECTVEPVGVDAYRITLMERDQGIAPGQFAVLYEGEQCLGGGVITQTV
ncbi:tRNA 2-thiouridine(34) synthase MnmA [Candidatus Dependentiae bacterium]|nr:tRNA 2-thiouridine(34) synthase MnmA [Candidatus Dependentiae bacterium]